MPLRTVLLFAYTGRSYFAKLDSLFSVEIREIVTDSDLLSVKLLVWYFRAPIRVAYFQGKRMVFVVLERRQGNFCAFYAWTRSNRACQVWKRSNRAF